MKFKFDKDLEPFYATPGSAGFDLKSSENITIKAHGYATVGTSFSIIGNPSTKIHFLLKGRSGLASKHGILCHGGTIDNDYKGEIKAVLFNLSEKDYVIKYGERICQLVPICSEKIEDIKIISQNTQHIGFGSTGK